jgi:hypothetical protein
MFQLGPTPPENSPPPSLPKKPSQATVSMSSISQGLASSSHLVVEQDLTLLLNEIHSNQETVLESLEEANWRFDDASVTFNLEQEAKKAASYTAKLRAIRKVMVETNHRLAKLQERSFRVRQITDKQCEEAHRDWLQEIAYQNQLLAKFEPGPGVSPNSRRKGEKEKL